MKIPKLGGGGRGSATWEFFPHNPVFFVTTFLMRAHRIKSCDYICLRIKLSWLNGLECFIQPKLHLSISGHAKAYEPLVKLRRLSSGNIQGLVLEDVLVNPAIDNYHKLLKF